MSTDAERPNEPERMEPVGHIHVYGDNHICLSCGAAAPEAYRYTVERIYELAGITGPEGVHTRWFNEFEIREAVEAVRAGHIRPHAHELTDDEVAAESVIESLLARLGMEGER